MKALIVRILGIAGIIANYLFSKQGKLVLTWAAKAVGWVKLASQDKSLETGAAKFEFVYGQVEEALKEAGLAATTGTIRKIVEMAHGAWVESTSK